MDKYLVIAPRSAHEALLKKYRLNNPFCEVKVVSREEVYHSFFEKYDLTHIAYLMHTYNLTYDFATEIVEYFPYLSVDIRWDESGSEKIEYLRSLKRDVTHARGTTPLLVPFRPQDIFKERIVEVYYYQKEDFYLNYVFDKCGVKDVNYKTTISLKPSYSLLRFDRVDDEVLSTLNQICEIYSQDENAKVYLSFKSEQYAYSLYKYAPMFNLKINNLIEKPFSATPVCVRFMQYYEMSANIEEAYEAVSELFPDSLDLILLHNQINNCEIPFLSFQEQKVIFTKEFSKVSLKGTTYKGGIEIKDGAIGEANPHIFILGATLNDYPKSVKETSFLSASEKEAIGFPLASTINKRESDDLKNFISSSDNIHLSYSEYINDTHVYPTNIVDVKEVTPPYVTTYYSLDYAYIDYCKSEDMLENYLLDSPLRVSLALACPSFKSEYYRNFHFQYTPFPLYSEESPIYLSYSKAEKYIECPYHYFIDEVLKINDEDINFNADLGTIAHNTFERYYQDPHFDFDKVYQEEVDKLKTHFNSHQRLLLSSRIKDLLSLSLSHFKEHDALIGERLTKTYTELVVNYVEIKPESGVFLTGRLDKAKIIDDKYLFIVDYKSSPRILKYDKISEGTSLQLPTYDLLSTYCPELEDYSLCGLFYSQFLPKQIDSKNMSGHEYLKLVGAIVDDDRIIEAFDPHMGEYISLKRDNKTKYKTTTSWESFKEFRDTARETYLDIATSIRENKFPINEYPKKLDSGDSCTYCPYSDICFRHARIKSEEEEEDE
ncbi:MAG: PD-(D/E)XK nuclease family protein [Coprobacillus sp.]|nr:PD-(D/E)XK nuclease family protein [Coprobacillus sp.]